MKNLIIASLALVMVLSISCGESNPPPENAIEIQSRTDQQVETGGKPRDQLNANSVPEGDVVGRAKWSLGRVQEELNISSGKVKDLGKVSVFLDDNMMLIIRNEFDGDVFEKRVLLESLISDAKKMEFVVDKDADSPNPGVRIPVMDGKAPVELFKNGRKTGSEKKLELLFGERRQVQLVVSAMSHAIKVSQGDLSL